MLLACKIKLILNIVLRICSEYAQASSKAISTNHQTVLLRNILTPVARIQLIGWSLNSYVASKDQEDLGLNIDETPQICLHIYLKQWHTCVFPLNKHTYMLCSKNVQGASTSTFFLKLNLKKLFR